MRLVLASTSPARLALLTAAGIDPRVVPSTVDEPAAVAAAEQAEGRPLPPEEMVLLLARAKAEAVAATLPERDVLVLGGGSAFAFGGAIHGKPGTAEAAADRWRIQRGGEGVLHSGHWLIDRRTGRGRGAVASATVRFVDDLTDGEIDAYVATGEPLAVAGAFTIDSLGGPFIAAIGGFPSTVVGLSLPTLRRLVRE
ncbi:MAG: nucleoside triphosphate pyrophosphatase, partial [Microbacteriaceae bacterium]|nr:nucleoside triphosphate pyrophosphatase [Microbacteriaceae bacterium]